MPNKEISPPGDTTMSDENAGNPRSPRCRGILGLILGHTFKRPVWADRPSVTICFRCGWVPYGIKPVPNDLLDNADLEQNLASYIKHGKV